MPQSRERIFLIANLRSRGGREILPVTGEDGGALKAVIGGRQGYRVYDSSGVSASLTANGRGAGGKTGLYVVGSNHAEAEPDSRDFVNQVLNHPRITEQDRCLIARYDAGLTTWGMNSGVLEARALTVPDRLETRQQGRRMKEDGEPMFTLTCQDRHGVFLNGGKIRKLTPRECFRLQGFPDALYEKAAAVNSESQLYKQAGNAVTATVAYAVAMALPESRGLVMEAAMKDNGETGL
nr:MAG TPA: Cytosine specific methyltransferase [Caudoviricetes sp.]